MKENRFPCLNLIFLFIFNLYLLFSSDVQFEENAHGGSSALGTFVSSDSKGGKLALGGGGGVNNYVSSIGRESREITLRNARKRIVNLATHLRLRPDHIDMAFYFFKLALSKHLTR